MGIELFKKETAPIPMHVPVEWLPFMGRMAKELGTSRNSVGCMMMKLGGPMLQAHADALRASLDRNCKAIASGAASVSHFLHSAQFPGPVVKSGRNGKRNRKANGNRGNGRA